MSDFNSFLLVPNHSMAINDNSVIIELAEADMLKRLEEEFNLIGIAAFEISASTTSISGEIDTSRVTLHSLSVVEDQNNWRKIINYLHCAFILPLILRRYELVYIFCPGYCGLIAALWLRVMSRPYGLYVRGTWLNKCGRTSLWWRWVFEGAKFIVATGEAFKKRLLQYCENVVNEVPLTALTPTGVDISDLSERSRKRMIFVGRVNKSKGVRDVVRALSILKRKGTLVELLIAGGGTTDEIEYLHDLCDRLGVSQLVTFMGHIDPVELSRAYRRSSIFVFPSYFAEGFPRVIYEAMMYAEAIVTCEMPGTKGFLINGENCVYTKPADPQNLADNLLEIIQDQDFAIKIAMKARQDVERVYSSFLDSSHAEQVLRFA